MILGGLRTRISTFDVELERLVTSTSDRETSGSTGDGKVVEKILARACLNREGFLALGSVSELGKEGGVGEEAAAKAESEAGEGVMKLDDMVFSSSRGGGAGEREEERERVESKKEGMEKVMV